MDEVRQWVRKFLFEKFRNNGFPTEKVEEYKTNLQDPKFCQAELTKFFSHNFDEWSILFKVFGKVLTQLPKRDFLFISHIRNLILICPKISGGCVEALKLPVKKGKRIVLVTFDRDLISRSEAIIIGIVSHELAHIALKHYEYIEPPPSDNSPEWLKFWRGIQAQEPLANGKAASWGFGPEITMLNNRRKENQDE